MTPTTKYLTKSRFLLALQCPTKLYYTNKPDEYASHKADSFMFELAKGGMQIGELAKFYFVDDPIASNITIQLETRDYDGALAETEKRLNQPNKVIIAEASFKYEKCYVRADIVVKDEKGEIDFFEVKSKSYREGDDKFINKGKINSEWSEYLYDVAFQKWVIENSLKKKVKAHLVVVNKDVYASVGGLAKFFKVLKDSSDRAQIIVPAGTKRQDLGNELLRTFNIDEICAHIYQQPLKLDVDKTYTFEDGIRFLSQAYVNNSKIVAKPKASCSKCEFYTTEEEQAKGLKSGLKDCWVGNQWVTEKSFEDEDLVFQLWGGNAGGNPPVPKLIELNKYLLKDALRSDFDNNPKASDDGLGNHDRRELQIKKARELDFEPYVDREGVKGAFEKLQYPLHFIDFETTATALPWFKDMRPYQGVAFQFSHHVIYKDGRVAHMDQYLSFEPGQFPNIDFIRHLQTSLGGDTGTIFRYHNHENSYLNMIYKDLDRFNIPDKEELKTFIRSITEWDELVGEKKKRMFGERNMVDLYKIVLKYFYSLHAKGSNSLKHILPAAIKSFPFLVEKYSKPIYGNGLEIESLNFSNKIWISEEFNYDPYKTLEPVFEGYTTEELDRLVEDTDTIADGGSAMMAYNLLQFSEIPLDQRDRIREALLKYCELDTLAMVMLYEGLKSSINT